VTSVGHVLDTIYYGEPDHVHGPIPITAYLMAAYSGPFTLILTDRAEVTDTAMDMAAAMFWTRE